MTIDLTRKPERPSLPPSPRKIVGTRKPLGRRIQAAILEMAVERLRDIVEWFQWLIAKKNSAKEKTGEMVINWRKGVNRLIFVISVIVGVVVAFSLVDQPRGPRGSGGFELATFIVLLPIVTLVIWGTLLWLKSGFTKPPEKGDS